MPFGFFIKLVLSDAVGSAVSARGVVGACRLIRLAAGVFLGVEEFFRALLFARSVFRIRVQDRDHNMHLLIGDESHEGFLLLRILVQVFIQVFAQVFIVTVKHLFVIVII